MESLDINSLPLGFGFHPTDEELTSHYLKRKVHGQKVDSELIPVVDIYKHDPWDLPEKCPIPTRGSQWHFFSPRDRKYRNSFRCNRATKAGYWKSTGKDRDIKSHNQVLGTKKTLVFHEGRPPKGKRTEWIIHEYYIDEKDCKASSQAKDTFVLCRVTKRDGWASQRSGHEVQEESVQTGEGTNSVEKPKDTPDLAADMNNSNPCDIMDDTGACTELLPTNSVLAIIAAPNNMTETLQEDLFSVAPKQEPVNSPIDQGEADEFAFLSKEDIDSILQFDPNNFAPYDGLDIVALADEIIPPSTSQIASNSFVLQSNFIADKLDGSFMLSDDGLTSELNATCEMGVLTQQIPSSYMSFPAPQAYFPQIRDESCNPIDSQINQDEADEFDFLLKEDIDSILQFDSDNFALYNGIDMELIACEGTPLSTSYAASNSFCVEGQPQDSEINAIHMLSDVGSPSSEFNGTSETGIVLRQNLRPFRSSSAPEVAFKYGSCKLKVSRGGSSKMYVTSNHRTANGARMFTNGNYNLERDEDHETQLKSSSDSNSYPSDAESDSGSIASETSQESVVTTSGTPRKSDTVADNAFNNKYSTRQASGMFHCSSKSVSLNYLLIVLVVALAAIVHFLLHRTPALTSP